MNILKQFIGADQVDDTKVLLRNNQSLRARNAANSGNVNLLSLNAADEVALGTNLIRLASAQNLVLGYNTFLQARNSANTSDVNVLRYVGTKIEMGGDVDMASFRLINTYVEPIQLASDPTGVTGQVYYNTVSNTLRFYNGTAWADISSGGGGATTALDNLAAVAVNTDLLPDGDATRALGGVGFRWSNAYVSGLVDQTSVTQISLDSRQLNDATGTVAIDWSMREARASDGTTTMIQWVDQSVGVLIGRDLLPVNDNTNYLGAAGARWLGAYIQNLWSATNGNISIDTDGALKDGNGQVALVWTDGNAIFLKPNTGSGLGKQLYFYDQTGTNFVGLRAANSLGGDVNYVLPLDGTAGQVLSTNGSGVLSWASTGGASANQTLSNLTSPVAANQDISSELLDTILVNYGAQEPNAPITTAFGATNSKVAVQFTLGSTTPFNAIEVWIAGTPRTGQLQASVYTDNAGVPGTQVIDSVVVDASTIAYGSAVTKFELANGLGVNSSYAIGAGTYWIVLSTFGGPLSGDITLFQSSTHPAPGNTFVYNGSWSDDGQVGMAANIDMFTTHSLGTSDIPWAKMFVQNIMSSFDGFYSNPLNISTADVANGTSTGALNLFTGSGTVNGSSGAVSLFSGDSQIQTGDALLKTGNILGSSGAPSGQINITSGNSDQGQTGHIILTTGTVGTGNGNAGGIQLLVGGAAGSGSSNGISMAGGDSVNGFAGSVQINSGSASGTGNSGDIVLNIGSVSGGTQGKIKFGNGTPSVIGQVWTATDVDGSGYWANAAGGGANTALSNLVATQINQDLIFDEGAATRYIGWTTQPASTMNLVVQAGSPVGSNGGTLTLLSGGSNLATGGVALFGSSDQGDNNNLASGAVIVKSGDGAPSSATGNTGNLTLRSGSIQADATSGNTGFAFIGSGPVQGGTGASGAVNLFSGDVSGAGNTGVVQMYSGSADGGGNSGGFMIGSGHATVAGGASGNTDIRTGGTEDQNSGSMSIYTGSTNTAGNSGLLAISSGLAGGSGNSGLVSLISGQTQDGTSGGAVVSSGTVAGTGSSGGLSLSSGDVTGVGGNSGDANLFTGIVTGTGNATGNINIYTGAPQGGGTSYSGNIGLATGVGLANGNSGALNFNTGTVVDAASGSIDIETGAASGTGNSGNLAFVSGYAPGGTSGNIEFYVNGGNFGNTGRIRFVDGNAAPAIGYVWTAIDTAGHGEWAPAAGGGANTALSNLAAVAINDVLNFGTGVTGIIKTNAETGATASTTMLVQSGATVDGNSAGVQINSGDVSGNGSSGGVDILSGAVAGTGASGAINLTTAVPTSGARGEVSINTRILNISGAAGDQGNEQIRLGIVGGNASETGFAIVSQDASAGNISDAIQIYSGSGTAANSSSGGVGLWSNSGDVNSGAVTISSGSSNGTLNGNSGQIALSTGAVGTGAGVVGGLSFVQGNASGGAGIGDILIQGGSANNAGTAGNLSIISSGFGTNGSGGVTIRSGTNQTAGQASGALDLRSGDASSNGNSGGVTLGSGSADQGQDGEVSGQVQILTGQAYEGSGPVLINTGNSTKATGAYSSGDINLTTGSVASAGASGTIALTTGNTTTGVQAGAINLIAGNDGAGLYGQIQILGGMVDIAAYTAVRLISANGSQPMPLRFMAGNNATWLDIVAPATIATNFSLILPAADGTAGQALKTDGAGTLSFGDAGGTWAKERIALSGTDITNQYIDLGHVAKTDSISFIVKGGNGVLIEGAGDDYSVNYTGGAGGNTRITFLNDIATGGPSALTSSNIVVVQYQY